MIDTLIKEAECRGHRVYWHTGGPPAAWLPHRNMITVRVGMTDVDTVCALAHELGHAHHNDPPGHQGAYELRADRFAAQLLISPADYAAAESLYGPHPARLAHELGVTVNVLKTWQATYQRQMSLLF